MTCWVCKDLLAVLWDLGRAIVPWGVCFVCVVGRCKCIRCIVCEQAHPDIVAPLGILSRAGLTWGTPLSTWESPWKRAPKVTPGRFSPWAGRKPAGGTQVHGRDAKCPRAGRQMSTGGTPKLPVGGTRAGLQAVQPAFQKHLSGEDRRCYVSHFLVLRY